jgi:Holliday junction resolvase RusA-like endonuclease
MNPRIISEAEHQAMVNRVKERCTLSDRSVTADRVRVNSVHRQRDATGPSPSFRYNFSIIGQIPSGKNQVQLLWRKGKVHRYPNKTFTNWRAKASLELLEQKRPTMPLSAPIALTCNYWPGNRIIRDVSGQLDALFSLLVYANILKNDGLIWSVWWRRHAVCRFPKLVMDLEAWQP